jgi:transposase
VLSDSPCERIGKWETYPILKEDRSLVPAKTATLLGVSRATVSKVMSAYTNHGKTAAAKRNSGRKSTLTERDRHTLRKIVSKNSQTTAAHMTGNRTEY